MIVNRLKGKVVLSAKIFYDVLHAVHKCCQQKRSLYPRLVKAGLQGKCKLVDISSTHFAGTIGQRGPFRLKRGKMITQDTGGASRHRLRRHKLSEEKLLKRIMYVHIIWPIELILKSVLTR